MLDKASVTSSSPSHSNISFGFKFHDQLGHTSTLLGVLNKRLCPFSRVFILMSGVLILWLPNLAFWATMV